MKYPSIYVMRRVLEQLPNWSSTSLSRTIGCCHMTMSGPHPPPILVLIVLLPILAA